MCGVIRRIHFAAISRRAVTIGIAGGTGSESADTTSTTCARVGEAASRSARVAIVWVVGEVGLATIANERITVGKTGIAGGDRTIAGRAGPDCVGRRTCLPAHVAILQARTEVRFATIGGKAIAVAEATSANDAALAARASGCSVRGIANIATGAAIGQIRINIGLAAVRVLAVAILEIRAASAHHAGRIQTSGAAVLGNAGGATRTAICSAVSGSGFAAIADVAITIAEPGGTGDTANTPGAAGRPMRTAARGTTLPTVGGIRRGIRLTAVRRAMVAVLEASLA